MTARSLPRGIALTGVALTCTFLVACGSGDGGSAATSTAASAAASSAAAPQPAASSQDADAQYATMTSTPSPDGDYTLAQVKEHATPQSCWSTIDGGVYDLTDWIDSHYGGARAIKELCGTDGTAKFMHQHASFSKAKSRLATFKIGTLKG